METMSQYLDRAKAATATTSDSNLGRKIGVTRSAVSQWRIGYSFPSEVTMLTLAKRAKLDPAEALILLNLWKAEGEAKSIYERLLKSNFVQANDRLKKFGVIFAIVSVFFSPLGGIDAQAAANAQFFEPAAHVEISHKSQSNKHYAMGRCSSHIVMRQLSQLEMRHFS